MIARVVADYRHGRDDIEIESIVVSEFIARQLRRNGHKSNWEGMNIIPAESLEDLEIKFVLNQ